MFPHTDHCEMVMVFDRMTQSECDGKDGETDNKKVTIEASEDKPSKEVSSAGSKDADTKSEGQDGGSEKEVTEISLALLESKDDEVKEEEKAE
jgi:hypothetical protein